MIRSVSLLQSCRICQIRVTASTSEPLVAVAAWMTTSCVMEYCLFKKVTSMAKEVIWKVPLSIRPKGEACNFTASGTLVELMWLHLVMPWAATQQQQDKCVDQTKIF